MYYHYIQYSNQKYTLLANNFKKTVKNNTHEVINLFIVMIRTIILYFVVVIIMRIMGKRQIGQLQPFELAIAIMISELASFPMQDTRIPLLHGIIPIVTLLILEISISVLQLKSEKSRKIICGTPSILIKNGKIDINQLREQKLNLDDLMEELRLKDYYDLGDIAYAILETSGQLSVIPKTALENVTKKDMKINCSQSSIPVTLIMDGKINYDNLKVINKDEEWLIKQLKDNNISSPSEVFIAVLDSQKKFFYQKKNK